MFDQADLLAQLIEEKDLHHLTLVGHSFGGGVALMLALEAKERLKGRIAKLVLLDTDRLSASRSRCSSACSTCRSSRSSACAWCRPRCRSRVALRIAYLDDSKIDPEEVETYAAPLKTAAGKHAMIHSARQIMPDGH